MEQSQPIDVTPQKSREDVLARKQAQIEQLKQEQEQEQRQKKEVEPVEAEEEAENPVQEDPIGNSLNY